MAKVKILAIIVPLVPGHISVGVFPGLRTGVDPAHIVLQTSGELMVAAGATQELPAQPLPSSDWMLSSPAISKQPSSKRPTSPIPQLPRLISSPPRREMKDTPDRPNWVILARPTHPSCERTTLPVPKEREWQITRAVPMYPRPLYLPRQPRGDSKSE